MLDALSRPSRPGAPNEDAAGHRDGAAWVIDGATGVSERPPMRAGSTDAAWLAAWLDDALGRFFGRPAAAPEAWPEALEAELRAAYAGVAANGVPPAEQPSACIAVAAVADDALHLFCLGDCRVLVEAGSGVWRFGTSELDRLDALMLERLRRLKQERPDTDAMAAMRPAILQGRALMNAPGGYYVVHPTRSWRAHVQHACMTLAASARPAASARHILIASDGFLRLVDVFGAYTDAELLRAALDRGLAALHAELRAREAEDAGCDRFLRLKPYDDASAVLARTGSD